MEVVIPDFLQPLKRYLEKFAFKVRERARTVHKTKFSTSIRMDDGEMSLYIATRQVGHEKWNNYRKEELEQMDEDFNRKPAGEDSDKEEDSDVTLTPTADRSRNRR